MKNKKIFKIILILFIFIVILDVINIDEISIFPSSISQYAATVTSGNYTYIENDNGTIIITAYTGSEVNITVPSTIDGKKVTSIRNDVFYNLPNLKTVTLSEGIEDIDMYTFSGCANLEKVTFPNSIKYISRYFYKACPKIKYNIPSHLKEMEEGTYIDVATVTVNGTKSYDYVNQVFELTNQERINNGLEPLKYSAELTEIAMKRAAESSCYWNHIRPCGMDCFTISSVFDGENLGALSYSPQQVVSSWMASPLHKRAILNESYNSIGIGCYKVNGVYYWVQTFSTDRSNNEKQTSGTKDVEYKVDIKSNEDVLNSLKIYEYSDNITLKLGETKSVTKAVLINLPLKEKKGRIIETPIATSDITWSSSDENIFTVDENGKITTKGPGSAILTAKLGDCTKTFNINVVADGVTMALDKIDYQLNGISSTIQLNAMLSTGSPSKAEWKSSNESIATVDSNGLVTAKNGGFVYITATNAFGKSSCYIYVCALRTLSDGSKAYPGDLDRNGVFNSTDMAIISDWANSYILTEDEIAIADINCDGIVNSNDMAFLSDIVNYSTYSPGKYTPIQSVSLNKTTLTLDPGDNSTLTTSALPLDNTDGPKRIWSSTNKNVATVDENGIVTAKMPGTTIIKARALSGAYATCTVTVNGTYVPINKVTLNRATLILDIGESSNLIATISPTQTSDISTLTWNSSDTNIATVNTNGKVTAKNSGVATITVTTSNGKTDTCIVTVNKKVVATENVILNKKSVTLQEGDIETLVATISPSNHTDSSELSWKSSDVNVATVDNNGKVTAKKAGSVTITVTANGKSAQCLVEVESKSQAFQKGDINKDTFINSTDAALVLDIFKNGGATEQDFIMGDMNGDNQLDSTDAATILDIFKNGK